MTVVLVPNPVNVVDSGAACRIMRSAIGPFCPILLTPQRTTTPSIGEVIWRPGSTCCQSVQVFAALMQAAVMFAVAVRSLPIVTAAWLGAAASSSVESKVNTQIGALDPIPGLRINWSFILTVCGGRRCPVNHPTGASVNADLRVGHSAGLELDYQMKVEISVVERAVGERSRWSLH